ncbi:MAG TPA: ATP-binding protein [Anaerolineales bacterium]|nr:ATP-binding protein [Anaerolineales bacterium]
MPSPIPPHRPPWWPADEAWPPTRRHWRRGQFRRGPGAFLFRIWLLFGVLFVFGLAGCALVSWVVGFLVGLGPMPRPEPRGFFFTPSLFLLAILFGGFGVFLTLRALRRATAPISEMMEAAGKVEEGDYTVRVQEHGPREVRELARAFNAMTERLEKDEEQRRALLADVTHELRTPLTVMQGNLEALLDGVYPRDDDHLAPILDETRVLSRLVEDLRTLSLAESGALKLHKEPVDLEILIAETSASFRAQSDSAGVEISVNIPNEIPVLEFDPVRIREVLTNLISNALRYTPAGGAIEIAAQVSGDSISVAVRDTGTGIPPEDLPHVFDRFYKSEQSRGMGLGLAIAKNLVAAHGGEIVALSRPGGGTEIRFTLPA